MERSGAFAEAIVFLEHFEALADPRQAGKVVYALDEVLLLCLLAVLAANQLRLWFSSFAYLLMAALRHLGLQHTEVETATCGTIRLKLLKIGPRVTVSVRRIKIAMASACPSQAAFALTHTRLRAPPG